MGDFTYARSFRDLIVYQTAFKAACQIFELSKHFPEEERYSLVSQIRRSSRSIGAQITEAWGKRRYEPHFVSKLTDADAEQMETQHWLRVAFSCGYIDPSTGKELTKILEEIGRMLQGMIDKANTFCALSPTAQEPNAIYKTELNDPDF